MLSAFMVDLVARTKLRKSEETRTVYEVNGVANHHRCPHWEAWEVVTRQESLSGQIPVWIEVRFILTVCPI